MSSTLTTNSHIGGKPIGKSIWPMRLDESTAEDNFVRVDPVAVFIYEIRVADIGPAPQRFVDVDHNNSANGMIEAGFQMVIRACEKMIQTYYDSTEQNPEAFPLEMYLETVLRPEGEEVVEKKDQESRDARDLVANFVENFYGRERFKKESVTAQTGTLNIESIANIRYMQGFDHRRVYAYRFHIFIYNKKVNFSAQIIGVVDIAIDLYKRYAGVDNDEFAVMRRNNKFAKASKGNNNRNGNGGGGGGGGNNDNNDALKGNNANRSTTAPLSHNVFENERWKLIKSYNDYITFCAAYLRDESWCSEQKKRELLNRQNPLPSPENPLCPINVFGAQTYFRSAAEKRLPIDEKQLDIANYFTIEKDAARETRISAKFPYPKLVLRVPIDKLSSGIEVANMFLPDVQKRIIEPHLDLQRSVGAGIERIASAVQSVADADASPEVGRDQDDDVDDKRPQIDGNDDDEEEEEAEIVQRQRNAPLIRRGMTDSADDGDASRNAYESIVQASVDHLSDAADRSLDMQEDDFSASSSAITLSGRANDDDDNDDGGAPFIGGRRLEVSPLDNPDLAEAIREVQREANNNAARAHQQNMPRQQEDHAAEALQHSNPLINERADIFATLTRHMGAGAPHKNARHVANIDASYVINGDFGDAKQMELNKAILSANEEGGINRTDHHMMRSRIFHGVCAAIAKIQDPKQRTTARLQMMFRAAEEYRNKCGSSVSNISNPMKMINVWYEEQKRNRRVQFDGEIRFFEKSLSMFAHTQIAKLFMFDQVCFIYTAHAEVLAALYCAMSAYWYRFDLRLHPLFYGPAGSSKSEVLSTMARTLISGTVEAVTNESQQADATDENENDVIRILHELPAAWVTKAQADSHKIEGLKNQMTAGISTRVVLDISNGQRRRVYVTSEKQIVYCAASNLDEEALEKAVRDRFLLFHQVKRHRPDCTIDQKMAQMANAPLATRRTRERFEYNMRLTQYNFAHTEKYIMIGILCRPSLVVTPIVLARYMQALEQCSGFRGDRRLSDKILTLARVLTIETAITWVYRSPMSPCYMKEVDLWYLLLAEPFMKDTEEIAMYALDIARSQCINPDQEQFLHVCREWILPKEQEKHLEATKSLLLFPIDDQTIYEVNNAKHQMFRRWHYDHSQNGPNYTLINKQKTKLLRQSGTSKSGNNYQQHQIVGTQTTTTQYAAITANTLADAVKEYTNATASKNTAIAAPAIGAAAAASQQDDGNDEPNLPYTEEEAKALKAADEAADRLARPQQVQRGEPKKTYHAAYNHQAGSVADLMRQREQKAAFDAQYNWQYVSFFESLSAFAARVAHQNSEHKGARETNAAAIEKLCRDMAKRKITSKLYIPNPASYNPPVIIDESSEPTVQDMIILPADNSCVYIHSSLLIGEYKDPHEIALAACASNFTPSARFLSGLPYEPSTPHVFKVRDVGPNNRTNFTFSIDKMTRQAELLGFTREAAMRKGDEHDADEVELDEDDMRKQKPLEKDENSHKAIFMSLDDFSTQMHLKSLGMPLTENNMNFFNARINDNAARRIPGATIQVPMTYPDDVIATMKASQAKTEELMREFTGLSLSELNLKRSAYAANIIDVEYDADEEVGADSITPQFAELHRLCATERDDTEINLLIANARLLKQSNTKQQQLLRSSSSTKSGGAIETTPPSLSPSQTTNKTPISSTTTSTTTATTTKPAAAATAVSTPSGSGGRKMRKTAHTSSTTPQNPSSANTSALSSQDAATAESSYEAALDRLVDTFNTSVAPLADPHMPRLKNTSLFNYNAMRAVDDNDDNDSISSSSSSSSVGIAAEAPPLSD